MSKLLSASRVAAPAVRRFASVVAASALAALCTACAVENQRCPEGTNYNDRDDDCPYGPPGGPKVNLKVCPPVAAVGDCNGLTWTEDIYPLLEAANCTAGACHGTTQLNKVYLPPGNAAAVFTALTTYKGPGATFYIEPEDSRNSWIQCNLGLSSEAIGFTMPIGSPFAGGADLLTWLGCGAPR
jgi:hypothetical protein